MIYSGCQASVCDLALEPMLGINLEPESSGFIYFSIIHPLGLAHQKNSRPPDILM
jgi:hypothetical protein